jgi:hypothetical protein
MLLSLLLVQQCNQKSLQVKPLQKVSIVFQVKLMSLMENSKRKTLLNKNQLLAMRLPAIKQKKSQLSNLKLRRTSL